MHRSKNRLHRLRLRQLVKLQIAVRTGQLEDKREPYGGTVMNVSLDLGRLTNKMSTTR